MRDRKLLQQVLALTTVVLILAGCGGAEATPTSTSTPIPPTSTPVPPTSTPVPPTPMPGWKKFEGRGMELWLPESFAGGDPTSEDLDLIVEGLRSLGPDFYRMAQMVEQNRSAFVIWAFESEISDSGILTNAVVGTEKVLSALQVETYLDAVIKQLPGQFRVEKQEIIKLGEYEAGRLELDVEMSGAHQKQVLYTIKDGGTMWSVNYTTGADEMDQRLPIFEQSISTFRIVSSD